MPKTDNADTQQTVITPDLDNIRPDVDYKPIEIPQPAAPDDQQDAPDDQTDAAGTGYDPEVNRIANTFIIKLCIEAIGQIAYNITKVPEAKTDDISSQIAEIWADLIPSQLSPTTAALMATLMLVSPKVAAVIAARKHAPDPPDEQQDAGGAMAAANV